MAVDKVMKAAQPPLEVKGVKHIVAVALAKAARKSTVSANLAAAMRGWLVGLLDAMSMVQAVRGCWALWSTKPRWANDTALRNHGVTVMSLGLMMPDDEALIWRGPMLMGALQQMLGQVQWGQLDVLLVDLPPGTGDVQMTLSQKVSLTGAVVVSTPQDIALLDAKKGIDMFRRMNVPLLGFVETWHRSCATVAERSIIRSVAVVRRRKPKNKKSLSWEKYLWI